MHASTPCTAHATPQRLRAHHDALGSIVSCLGALIEATRPLRRACRRAAEGAPPPSQTAAAAAASDGGGSGNDNDEDDPDDPELWGELRELCLQLQSQPNPRAPPAASAAPPAPAAPGHGGGRGSEAGGGAAAGDEEMAAGRSGSTSGSTGGSKSWGEPPDIKIEGEGPADKGSGTSPAPAAPQHSAGSGSGSGRPAVDYHGFSGPRWAEYMGLEDGADAALRRYRAMTAADVAARVQQYVQVCSVDLFRLGAGASDNVEAADARLAAQLDRLMAFSAALLASNPLVLGEVSTCRLDTLARYGAADAPPRAHWLFALRQAGLSARQRFGMARLMELYNGRLAAILPRRQKLLDRQAGCADDPGAQAELLVQLERVQAEYTYSALAFANALYGCILAPRQVGFGPFGLDVVLQKSSWLIGIWPHAWQVAAGVYLTAPPHSRNHRSLSLPSLTVRSTAQPGPQAASIWAASYPLIPQLVVLGQALQDLKAEDLKAEDLKAEKEAGAVKEGQPPSAAGSP
jgi:hypothetical protein